MLPFFHRITYTLFLRFSILRELRLARKTGKKLPESIVWKVFRYPHLYETWIWFLRISDPNEAVSLVDIGGNSGYWSEAFRTFFPKGKTVAFEPVHDMFEQYRTRYSGNENVSVHNVALSDKAGKNEINVAKGFGLTSFNTYDENLANLNAEFGRKEAVQIEMLDSFKAEIDSLPGKKVVKIDIQGWETHAVRGGLNVLRQMDAIVIECSLLNEFKDSNPTFPELTELLLKLDFYPVLFGVFNSQKTPVGYERDVLFVKKYYLNNFWGY